MNKKWGSSGPISHILSFLVLSQLPPSFNRSFPPPGFSLEPYGGGHTFYSGEQKYLPTSAIFVNFGIRRGIGKYCWRLVLKYFLSGETFALLKIWIHHRWKYLILTNLKSCNVSLKYQIWKREMEDECEFLQVHGHSKHGEQGKAENNKSRILIPVRTTIFVFSRSPHNLFKKTKCDESLWCSGIAGERRSRCKNMWGKTLSSDNPSKGDFSHSCLLFSSIKNLVSLKAQNNRPPTHSL